jgi:hypothetical protein
MRCTALLPLLAAGLACASDQPALDVSFTIPVSTPREVRCPELGEGSCVEFDRIVQWRGTVTGSVIGKERVLCLDEGCSEGKGVLRGRFAGRSSECGDVEGEFSLEEELSGTEGQLAVTEGKWRLRGNIKGKSTPVRGSGELKDLVVTGQGTSGSLDGEIDCI